jgi:two-component system capsular synthesis sensor histidine kinase RcsC
MKVKRRTLTMLIADEMQEQPWQGEGRCSSAVATSAFRLSAPGEWVHSVATPHELLSLLARIYKVELEERRRGRIAVTGVSGVGE